MTNGEGSYTGVMQQVMVQLGRIEGKMDTFDSRLRNVENQQAAWQELVKIQEPDFERWKQRIDKHGARLDVLEERRGLSDALKHYWYVVVLVIIPVALNSAYVISHMFPKAP